MVACFALLISSACAGGTTEGGAPSGESAEVRLYVLAAASLTDAVREIQIRYEAANPGVRLVPSFAGSGRLKQQIERGAPADLFLSAGTGEMDDLIAKDLIDSRLHTDLLENELVVIAPKGTSLKGLADLAEGAKQIAIGQPETVPAGKYAQEALKNLGLWEKLRQKLVFASDARQVLAYVKTGNVDAGLVYRTDSMVTGDVVVIDEIPSSSHSPIIYPVGVVKKTDHPSEAEAFYRWLQGEEARSIFEKHGFKGVAATTAK